MLKFAEPMLLPNVPGVTVYADSDSLSTFYVLADGPRFRIEDGLPVFKFIKYRNPIERASGKKGGGFVVFDTTFDVDEAKMTAVRDTLQAQLNARFPGNPPVVRLATIPWLRGTAKLLIESAGGEMVEKVSSSGKPSLFGRNIASFALELSDMGATLFESALQGRGGFVSVTYDLFTMAKLPPLTVRGHFSAEKFYSFHQDVHIDFSIWSEDTYNETVREQFRDSSSYFVKVDPGGILDQKVISQIRDWANRTMEDSIEKKMIESIAPVSAEDRKVPDGIDKLTRDISTTKVASFDLNYTEYSTMEWNPVPNGAIPNITNLKGPDGQPLKWEDFAKTVDLDDPFFKTLDVMMLVNADFTNLPIHSVEVSIAYPSGAPLKTFLFTQPEDKQNFQAFLVNNNRNFDFAYEVNYKGSNRTFKSPPIPATDNVLVVNLDDLGFLHVAIQPGNLSFGQIERIQVTMQYEDRANGIALIEQQFMLTEANPTAKFEKLLFVPRSQPYSYRVKYFMADDKTFEVTPREGNSPLLLINSPFTDSKTIGIRALGNLDTQVDAIFVDLKYEDETNQFIQTNSIALSKDAPFFNWTFPIIDAQKGKTTYSGTIRFKNGMVEDIPENTLQGNTLMAGPKVEDILEVLVIPELLDFSLIKLVKVSLRYKDAANQIDESRDFTFNLDSATTTKIWELPLKDKDLQEYSHQTTYFMKDNTQRKTTLATTTEPTLILELPN